MKLLIVEPRAHGHHFSLYLLNILREALRRRWAVQVLTTQDALDHPAMSIIAREFDGRVAFSKMPVPRQWMNGSSVALLANQLFYYLAMRRGYRAITAPQFDAIFIMDLDSVDKALALFGSPFRAIAVSGVFVHLKFHWPSIGLGCGGRSPALARWFFHRLLSRRLVRSVSVIDETFASYIKLHGFSGADKVVIVAEPAVTACVLERGVARALLGVDDSRFVVLVYGAHTMRKGLHYLLEALSRIDDPGIRVIVAGDMDGEVRLFLSLNLPASLQASGRLQVIGRFINHDEEQALFSASDVVWLGYGPGFVGQSAILPLAAAYGVPVLAKSGGMIGSITRKHGIGLLVCPERIDEVADAVLRLMADHALLAGLRENALTFARGRTMEGFAGAICAAMEPKNFRAKTPVV